MTKQHFFLFFLWHYCPWWTLASYFFRSCSTKHIFYGVELLASHPTPNLEDQSIPFCLGHHLWPGWHGRPYQ